MISGLHLAGVYFDEEDIFSAASREVKEETGLIVEPVKPIYRV